MKLVMDNILIIRSETISGGAPHCWGSHLQCKLTICPYDDLLFIPTLNTQKNKEILYAKVLCKLQSTIIKCKGRHDKGRKMATDTLLSVELRTRTLNMPPQILSQLDILQFPYMLCTKVHCFLWMCHTCGSPVFLLAYRFGQPRVAVEL